MNDFELALIDNLKRIETSLRALPRLVSLLEQATVDVEERKGYSGTANNNYTPKKAFYTKQSD